MSYEEAVKEYGQLWDFQKKSRKSKVYWTAPAGECIGVMLFSLDKKNIYNLFYDFPHNLTDEEVKIFCKSEPFWAEFFCDRLEKRGITY